MYLGLGIRKKIKDLKRWFSAETIAVPAQSFQPGDQLTAAQLPYWPVITAEQPNEIQLFRWGLIPNSATPLLVHSPKTFVTKSETLLTSTTAQESFLQGNRCLILVDRFFVRRLEGKARVTYQISLRYNQPFTLAGIYNLYTTDTETIPTFSILTTQANPLMQHLENSTKRMPVIVDPESEAHWKSELPHTSPLITSLLKPFDEQQMKYERISHNEQLRLF